MEYFYEMTNGAKYTVQLIYDSGHFKIFKILNSAKYTFYLV